MQHGGDQEESLRDTVARLVENAKAYARAELNLVRQTVLARVNQLRPALILGIAAILIVQAALVIAIAALGMLLALWIGPAGGLALAALIALAIAGLFGWIAVKRITGSSS
ncbi:hypothetical protein [Sphingomonas nostoxanthinifaciens]|uniref:hypothetical protein n=1 Tax=Sphingomonas nostoxanthinifaciens TaxID=2872652 RepID=UPI001CC20286|nr:hypothetical protein [Sphingomonas nostoxanthinifaciens]UAK23882.1 hypothetical protein K8P63_16165 [Sphingomonas nostoxanthinifaciens]